MTAFDKDSELWPWLLKQRLTEPEDPCEAEDDAAATEQGQRTREAWVREMLVENMVEEQLML